MIIPSTSGFAHGRHLGEVVDDLVASGAPEIQLAIGPRPYPGDVTKYLQSWRHRGVRFRAHANCPLGDKGLLNQDRDFKGILATCSLVGIGTYTCHAPRKKQFPSWQHFGAWAFDKYLAACEYGVEFAVETMYPNDSPYWLDSHYEVERFLEWAHQLGWKRPLATDVAHLQICVEQGTWTERQVEDLLHQNMSLEFHFSDNDGIHDNHKPWKEGHNNRIDNWIRLARNSGVVMIDEGRRRK